MTKKVLLIDDDPDIVDAIQMTLEDAGYETAVASKVEEALLKARDYNPDLIILDMLLSGHDGRTIAQQFKNTDETKAIPLLMISAHPDAAQRAKAAGVNSFLAKPFDISELIETVEELLT